MSARSDEASAGAPAPPRSQLARLLGFGLVLAGEAGQSGFHLLLNIWLLRTLSAEDYGIFAVTFVLASVGITYMQAMVGTPIGVILPRHRRAGASVWAASFTLASIALAVTTGVAVLGAVALWLGRPEAAPLAALFAAAWFLRGSGRAGQFARGRATNAGASDAAYVVAGLCAGGVAILFIEASPLVEAFGVLLFGHCVGLLVVIAAARPRIAARRRVLLRYFSLWPSLAWSVAGVTCANVQAQGQMLLVAALAGPAAYAPIAASMILFAPLRTLGTTLFNLLQPAFAAALAARNGEHARRLLMRGPVAIAAAGSALGLGVLLAFEPLENFLFEREFAQEPMQLLAVLAWGVVMTAQLYAAPRALVLAFQAFRLVALVNLVSAIIGIGLVTALLLVAGPSYALVGVVVSECVVLVSIWYSAIRSLRRMDTVGIGNVERGKAVTA